MPGRLSTVISGSYRKHLKELYKLKSELEKHDIIVMSPTGESALNPKEEFIILDSDPVNDHRTLQDSVFAKIKKSSFLVICNIDGYIGNAALIEIGYAISQGIQVFTVEPIEDPNIIPYTRLLSEVFKISFDEQFVAA